MWLLSNIDQNLVILHEYLFKNSDKKIPLKQVLLDLNFSKYNCINALRNLNTLYKEAFPTYFPSFQFNEIDNYVQIEAIQEISPKLLESYLIKNSRKLELLNLIITNKKLKNVEIADQLNISTTSLRRDIESMNAYLALKNIKINTEFEIIGDELAIRNFLFDLYFQTYSFSELPFSENLIALSQYAGKYTKRIKDMNQTGRSIYRLSFCLWMIRIQKANYVEQELSVFDMKNLKGSVADQTDILKRVLQLINPHINEFEKNSELQFALLGMVSLGMLNPEDVKNSLLSHHLETIDQIEKIISIEFHSMFDKNISKELITEISNRLLAVNLKYLYYRKIKGIHPFVKETNKSSVAYYLSENIIKRLDKIFIDITNGDYSELLIHYALCISVTLSKIKLYPEVNIQIDMTNMPNLTNLIELHLSNTMEFNIKVVTVPDDADIIISNAPVHAKNGINFIWQDVPDMNTIKNLNLELFKITKRKLLENNKNTVVS